MIWEIFAAGAVLALLFLGWYVNWRGPVKPGRLDAIMAKFENHPAREHTSADVLRDFLESDDGREFCMANYVTLRAGPVKHPVSEESVSSRQLVDAYMKRIIPSLLKRACHPVYQASRVGGHIDSWGSADRMEFPILAMMRYRSRRDFAEVLVSDTSPEALRIKFDAIDNTISFPARINRSLHLRLVYSIPLLILLVCCILQILATTF